MSSSIALRHARHLSTATAAAAAKPLTISQTKNKLRNVRNADEALAIYKSFTAVNDPSTSPSSTRHAQEYTVRLLAKSHRFSDIESFLESHKSKPEVSQEPFLSSLIRSYGTAGMFENALKTYEQMTDLGTPRTSLSFNSLLWACVQSKLCDRVPDYFNEFPAKFEFSPDKFSYGILIKSYCEMGSLEIAIEKLNEMKEKGFELDAIVFTTVLHSFYEKGMSDEAEKFWNDMVTKEGFKPDVGSYNVKLLNIQHGEPEGVKQIIEEMSNVGIKPDGITYNYVMTCYCENGMMDEAKVVYDEMLKAKGCNPNSATFRTLIFHMCKHERYASAYKVFKKSVEDRKIPDFNTLQYLAEGLAKKGHKKEVKAMIRTMNKKFPPNLLKAWGKLANNLGVAPLETEEVDSDKIEEVPNSNEAQEIST